MNIQFDVRGVAALQNRLDALPDGVRARLTAFMGEATQNLHAAVQANIADRFKSTGRLAQSVTMRVEEQAGGIQGIVSAGGNGVPYAAIQEYGGTVQIPEISPVRARVLAFQGQGGGMMFAMRTKAHPVTIPQHSYLRSALDDFRLPFQDGIRAAVQDALAEGASHGG